MRKHLFIFVLATVVSVLISSSAQAASVSWTNWTNETFGANGSAIGTMNFDNGTVDVSLSGRIDGFIDGDANYKGFPATYGGLDPSDIIQEIQSGNVTLTFSKPVVDPYIALVSVGRVDDPVTYSFQNPFTIVSYGPNGWGYGGYTVSGNNLTGREYNAVLKFTGTYSTLSLGFSPDENWHGFNVGAAATTPEPSSMIFGLMGIGGLLLKRKRK